MGADTTNNNDIAIWIEKVIESCTTAEQFEAAEKLVNLYLNKLQSENSKLVYYYSRILNDKLNFFVLKNKHKQDEQIKSN